MKFVFFGTDDFSVSVLEELKKAGHTPALVITAPDKPRGRGLHLFPSPAKLWAQENKVKFLQPEKLDQTNTILLASKIVDYFIVASYGKIIPGSILDIPEYGALNVHPSLLPRYRGASPIESQILADEQNIGVTIMQMDEQMDHGSMVAQKRLEQVSAPDVDGLQTSGAEVLRKTLAEMGGKLLAEVIPKWVSGKIKTVPQDESKATYTKKFTKEDGLIDLEGDAKQNFLKIRAFDGGIGTYFFAPLNSPFPKGSTAEGGEGFKSSASEDLGASFKKGGMKSEHTRVIIKSAEFHDDKLIITRVIPEGKREMSYEEFLRGIK